MLCSINNHSHTHSESLNDGTPATLFTVVGSDARLEGTFEVADSVQVECEVGGRLKVGKRLVIGERGSVRADVETVDAVISGEYRGNMVATGSVEITPTGRVVGTVETDSLVISKGGFFNGKTVKLTKSQDEGSPPGGEEPGREEPHVPEPQCSDPALPEPESEHTTEEQVLQPGDDIPASPPKRSGRARAAPRRPRRKQTTEGYDSRAPAPPKKSRASKGPEQDFAVPDIAEFLPPLPSGGNLLVEDTYLDGGLSPAGQPGGEEPGRVRAGTRSPRRKQTTATGHGHGAMVNVKASRSDGRPAPTSLVESMDEPLPPLPSRGNLLPEEGDADGGPPPGDLLRRREMGAGRHMQSGSAFRGDENFEDDRRIGREDWKRRPAPFPEDDPLGIR